MPSNRNFRSVAEHLAERDLTNRKPYRTVEQREEARRTAQQVSGRWVSTAKVSRHPFRGPLPGGA